MRIVMKCFGAYMLYNIATIVKKEMVLEQARVIKEYLPSHPGNKSATEETSSSRRKSSAFSTRPNSTWIITWATDT